jgi:hypothetical protein
MRNILFAILMTFGAVALSGCGLISFENAAVTDEKPVVVDEAGNVVDAEAAADEFMNKFGAFALNDVKAAMVLAGDPDFDGVVNAGGDPLANQCWFYWKGKLETAGEKPAITIAGVASALQVKRNLRRQGGISDEVKQACGGLILDSAGVVGKRLVKIAVPFL